MGEPVIHDCLEAIEATYSSCPDLKDTLPENTETWSTDGSSCVISGRHAGYVVTMSREVIESGPLPTNTSAQKAEITALTQALELAKGKKVNIYPELRSVRGSHRLGSDRQEFLSFQLGSERFVVAAGAAQVTKRRWEHEEIQAEE
ncbi:hypothetical protein DUI87_19569 [Hirundo rustica rustica]|uniref:RNase H type-1 domain-containing protein n=1 Tax=Hirundo rustica rustica TaxID=333673 RepID=A0A3M0JEF7_HIRRU|nr:hypothetical protein DUI87_24364 [Hirundo rustica rustica]RMC03816.1 hypothetical protein DUI87_19569 [Hirundo rustica rustica]